MQTKTKTAKWSANHPGKKGTDVLFHGDSVADITVKELHEAAGGASGTTGKLIVKSKVHGRAGFQVWTITDLHHNEAGTQCIATAQFVCEFAKQH